MQHPLPLAVLVILTSAGTLAADEAEDRAIRVLNRVRVKLERDPNLDGNPIVGVVVNDERFGDTALEALTALKQLHTLQFLGNQLTDAGMKHLARFEHLRSLHLPRHAAIHLNRAAVMGAVAALPQLEDLHLMSIGVNDADLKDLARLKRLRHLSLWGPHPEFKPLAISDQGLATLAGFSGLESLSLSKTQVTDAGLNELAKLKRLTFLHVSHANVTDEGVKAITSMKQLSNLHLDNTAITDRGLQLLSDLPQLTDLNLDGTRVTDAGVAEFKRKLPRCRVVWGFPPPRMP